MTLIQNTGSVVSADRTLSQNERGVTMLETMVALVILTVGVLGVMGILVVATKANWNQGDRTTRTTEYAQDKMEQLLALNFTDGSSNTTTYPTSSTGGTGLGGTMAGSATVGGVVSGSPVSQYVDYIDTSGNIQTGSTNALYIRQWSIATNASANMKTITVVVRALTSSPGATAPVTTLVSMKSQ